MGYRTKAAYATGAGPVPAPDMSAAAPAGVVFDSQKFTRKAGEPLELQIHHFLDVKREFLEIIEGKLIEDLADLLVNSVNVGPISLSRLIDPASQLKLSDDTYSLPIGFHSAVVQPLALGAEGATLTFAMTAPEDVFAFGPLGPSGPPPRIKIVSANARTARMALVFSRV
ncbi:MAG: hypothetical protein ACHQQS_00125 [Thermoanaerobaculales bacterium]